MSRILVLGAAAVQYDAVLAARDLGLETWVCAGSADGPAAVAADRFVELDFSDEAALRDLVAGSGIDLVYSVGSDKAMPVACRVSEELGLPRLVSSATATTCNNKLMMRAALGDLPGNVDCQVITSPDDAPKLPWPFIVKPADSQGQRGVCLVHDEEEFRAAVAAALVHSPSGRVIAETYLTGPELSVNGYLVEGQVRFLAVTDRVTWPQHTGLIRRHVVPSTTTDESTQRQVGDVVLAAAARLGITGGPVYAQVKLHDGAPHILEITPRLDGCHMWRVLRHSTGVDLLRTTLSHLAFGRVDLPADSTAQRPTVLEFRCQEPATPADYTGFAEDVDGLVDTFRYYEEGGVVRPVNGVFDKIGYTIAMAETA